MKARAIRDAAEALLTAGEWEALAAAGVAPAALAAALGLTESSAARELAAAAARRADRPARKTLPLPPAGARGPVVRHCQVCAAPISGRPGMARYCSEGCRAEGGRRRKRSIRVDNARGGRARHCPTLDKLL